MAISSSSSSSTFPTKTSKNRYTLATVFFLLLFLITLFLFSRKSLEPNLSLYRDLFSQTQFSAIHSPPRSNVKSEENGEKPVPIEQKDETLVPILSKSGLDDNWGQKNELKDKFDGKLAVPSSSKSDPGINGEVKPGDETLVFSKPGLQDEMLGGKRDEPSSSNEGETVPSSSKSDLGDNIKVKPNKKTEVLSTKGLKDELFGGKRVEPFSSTEEKRVPSSSNSDLVDETTGKPIVRAKKDDGLGNVIARKLKGCDLYKGTWVKDEEYPLYRPGSCSYVDEAFDCQSNGRPDSEYLKWRWKPDDCDLPRFNATDFLVRLRGKKLMLVGDSMNRNQFESLLCMLREALPNKSKMYETHGYKITKGRGYYVFKFEDYDCTVDFVRSHFLVKEGLRVNGQGNSNPTLSIDLIDKTAARWKRADILVFNTGHWWSHGKTARGKNYYKEGDSVYPQFDAVEAYRRAMRTWAKWVKQNTNDKLVLYRGYSSAHFRGGEWDSGGTCKGEKEPVLHGDILNSYPEKMTIVEEVIKEMHAPVVLLNVTRLTNFRKDGHPSIYGQISTEGKRSRRQDCSHWCLPGVPDSWNELIYATLVARS